MAADSPSQGAPRAVRVRPGLSVIVVLSNAFDHYEGVEQHVWTHGVFPQDPAHALALDLVKPGGRVLDVGAHMGSFALPASALGCEVLAVEACPRSAERLRASAEINEFPRLRVLHAAAGDHAGEVEFFPHGAWGHVRQDVERVSGVSVPVASAKVDDLLSQSGWDQVDLVKISVTGYEAKVIGGMSRLLSRATPPMVILRSNAHALHWYHESPRSLIGAMEQQGYHLYLIDPSAPKTLRQVQKSDLQTDLMADYLAVRSDQSMPAVPGWTIAAGLAPQELEQRVLAVREHPDLNYRCYMARELEFAPAWLRKNAQVQAMLANFRNSSYDKLLSASQWSGVTHERGEGRAVNDAVPIDKARYRTVEVKPGVSVTFAADPGLDDPIGRHVVENGFPDEPPLRLMMQLLQPGWRMFDLGAHLGTFCLPACALGCEVAAVEGSLRNVSLLRAAAAANRFDKLHIFHALASDRPGQADFFAKHAWGKMVASDQGSSDVVTMPTISGDQLQRDLGWERVNFIKMDIEGAEPLAIRGMSALLSGPEAPVMLFESNALSLGTFGESPATLRTALEQMGYATFYVDRETPRRLMALGSRDIQPDGVSDFLAFKERPASLDAWRIDEYSQEAVKQRLLAHAQSSHWEDRWYAAQLFGNGPSWLLEDDQVRMAAQRLSREELPKRL